MFRRVLILPLLVALLAGGVGCSGGDGARSTPPSSLNMPLPDGTATGAGGKTKTPPPPAMKVD